MKERYRVQEILGGEYKPVSRWAHRRSLDAIPTPDWFVHWLTKLHKNTYGDISTRYDRVSLDNVEQPDEVLHALADHLGRYGGDPGCDLMIFGPVGTGKTHISHALLIEHDFRAAASPYTVWSSTEFVSATDLARHDDFDQLCERAYLIIDDLGSERATPTTIDLLLRLIDTRWRSERQTVITSNLTPGEFADFVGERVIDRLDATAIVLGGPSRRRNERYDGTGFDWGPEVCDSLPAGLDTEDALGHLADMDAENVRALLDERGQARHDAALWVEGLWSLFKNEWAVDTHQPGLEIVRYARVLEFAFGDTVRDPNFVAWLDKNANA